MNNFEYNSTNSSNTVKDQQSLGNIMLSLVTAPAIAMITAIASLVILNTSLKKLNKIIKSILIVFCSHTILTSSVVGIMSLVSSYDKGTCSVIFVFMKSTVMVTIENLALISYVRYHLAWKTNNNENFNMFLIVGLVLAMYSVEYICQILVVIFSTHPYVIECSGIFQDSNKIPLIFTMIRILLALCIGTIYDVFLIKFLQKKNQSANGPGQAKLVPWKSSNHGEYDFNVPISATAIAIMVLIISVAGFTIIFTWNQSQSLFLGLHFMSFALPSILLPLLLAMSIRSIKKTKPLPLIPRGPMFHDNETSSVDNQEQVPQGSQNQELQAENLHGQELQEVDVIASSSSKIIYVKPLAERLD